MNDAQTRLALPLPLNYPACKRTHAGSPLPDAPTCYQNIAFVLRFQRKLKRVGDCMEWQGFRSESGYGQFKVGNRAIRAHRVAFMIAHHRWPHCDLVLCHSCDNRRCCNPDHLREARQKDNMDEREERRGYRWRNQHGTGWGSAKSVRQTISN